MLTLTQILTLTLKANPNPKRRETQKLIEK